MAKEQLNAAEQARKERKARIAKANKKNAKGNKVRNFVFGLIKKIICILLVLAIICGIGYWVLKVTGLFENSTTALIIGNDKVSTAEFSYYYSNMYQQTAYYAEQYAQYGYDMGYKSDTAPDEQTTTDADGKEITWAQAFANSAKERAQFVLAHYEEAVKAGYKLTDDQKKELDETIQSYKDSADENGFSLNAYLKSAFCPGFTEKKFRSLLEMETIAGAFYSDKQEEFKKNVSKDKVDKEYKDNGKNYDYAGVMYYTFAKDTLTADEGETEKALAKRQEKADKELKAKVDAVYALSKDKNSFAKAVKDYNDAAVEEADVTVETTEANATEEVKAEETADAAEKAEDVKEEAKEEKIVAEDILTIKTAATYSDLSSAIGEKGADWAFSADRKSGNRKLVESDSAYSIVFVTAPKFAGNSVNVRHILVKFDAADENNVTDEEKAAAKKEAEAILKEWKDGEKTEDSFAALAKEKTEDEGSQETGGLYENIRRSSSYVENFLNWCFKNHKVGDTDIVETEYGYHIMFFAKDNKDDLDWEDSIRTKYGEEDFNAYEEDLLKADGTYKITEKSFFTKFVIEQFCKKIKTNLVYNSQNA